MYLQFTKTFFNIAKWYDEWWQNEDDVCECMNNVLHSLFFNKKIKVKIEILLTDAIIEQKYIKM